MVEELNAEFERALKEYAATSGDLRAAERSKIVTTVAVAEKMTSYYQSMTNATIYSFVFTAFFGVAAYLNLASLYFFSIPAILAALIAGALATANFDALRKTFVALDDLEKPGA